MAVKTENSNIEGFDVSVTQMPARLAFMYKAKLVRAVGPSIGKLLTTESKGTGKTQVKINADFSGAFSTLADKLDPEHFFSLLLEGLRYTYVNGKNVGTEEEFDQVFTGKMELIYKVLFFSLKVNYKSFFEKGGIGKLFTQEEEMTPSEKISPK